ncbi:MAG: oppC [Verrucomicrobiaceae bacterium]|nr:oppC [Verrucomicrobiaceae bacterium]
MGFVLVLLLCLLGPYASPYSETVQDLQLAASAPSWKHWLGTDSLGRDVLTRVLFGGRISLQVGIAATLVASFIGVTYGMVAGLIGGRTDAIMMRIVDILYAFPFMTFVILLTTMFEQSLTLIFVAIGAVEWLTMARVVRGQVLALKRQEFITAARGFGTGFGHILRRHLLPNVIGIVIIYGSLTVPGVMMFEATLSFLGLGIQPPFASWGVLISEGAAGIRSYPWLLLGPAAFFCSTLLFLNTLGDSLRDALDPREVS